MKFPPLTIGIELGVDKSTAYACLKIVEVYLNSSISRKLVEKTLPDGKVELNFEEAMQYDQERSP